VEFRLGQAAQLFPGQHGHVVAASSSDD
jgi:hypothetical protein